MLLTERSVLFGKATSPEVLLPTSDTLKFHILGTHYQALIYKMAYIPNLTIPAPNQYGWKREQNSMIPIFASRNAIPQECLELVSGRPVSVRRDVKQCGASAEKQGYKAQVPVNVVILQEDSPMHQSKLNALWATNIFIIAMITVSCVEVPCWI